MTELEMIRAIELALANYNYEKMRELESREWFDDALEELEETMHMKFDRSLWKA